MPRKSLLSSIPEAVKKARSSKEPKPFPKSGPGKPTQLKQDSGTGLSEREMAAAVMKRVGEKVIGAASGGLFNVKSAKAIAKMGGLSGKTKLIPSSGGTSLKEVAKHASKETTLSPRVRPPHPKSGKPARVSPATEKVDDALDELAFDSRVAKGLSKTAKESGNPIVGKAAGAAKKLKKLSAQKLRVATKKKISEEGRTETNKYFKGRKSMMDAMRN